MKAVHLSPLESFQPTTFGLNKTEFGGQMKDLAKTIRQKLVGEFLKSSREKAGFTQLALARELGYTSAQFISNWERGIAMPPMVNLPELTRILAVPPKQMLEVLYKYQESFLALEKERLAKVFTARFRSASFQERFSKPHTLANDTIAP